jgi:predicted amidohydrolase
MEIVAAAAQMCSTDDLDANLARVRALGDEGAARGANLLVFPECFAFLGKKEGDKMPIAEVLDDARPGRILGTLAELATRHGAFVIGGGMPERIPGEDRRAYNTAVVVGPDGRMVARYRKIHLFDVDIPGGAVHRESDGTAPGDELVVAPIGARRVGLSICYDARFPEMYRELVSAGGADVVVVPAAFTAVTGRAHWHILLRARAIESQAWVVAAGQHGRHNEKRETFGHSMIIDPWGTIVGELPEGDGVVVAALDRAIVDEVRGRMPSRSHASLWVSGGRAAGAGAGAGGSGR